MRTDSPARSGQAAVEFALAVFLFALVLGALAGFVPVFLKTLALQHDVRCEAGRTALHATDAAGGGASARAFTAHAHPPAADGTDAWAAPLAYMPGHASFSAWRRDDVSAVPLIPAGRRQAFRFRLFVDGVPYLDEEGHLAESVALPALGGLGQREEMP